MGTVSAPASSHDHRATFYDDDAELVAALTAYVEAGFAAGEVAVIIATAEHRRALSHALADRSIDTAEARRRGDYLELDAAETLASFTADGVQSPELFRSQVGGVLARAASRGRPIRAFGEMVALLWVAGDVAGALELEAMWNELMAGSGVSFGLLCAYASPSLAGAPLAAVNGVCRSHSGYDVPASYRSRTALRQVAAETSRPHESMVFLPAPEAVAAVRRFAQSVLQGWSLAAPTGDVTLVVSELATNAIRHAASAFRVSLTLDAGTLRVEVEDTAQRRPRSREAAPDDLDGRGLAIVAELAGAWGHTDDAATKWVWAEFELPSALGRL